MDFDFLICSERSGSNLITQILDSNSQVCGPFPSHLMLRVGRHVFRYGDLASDGNWHTLLKDVSDYLAAMHSVWKVRPGYDELVAGVQHRHFGAVMRYVYEKEASAWGKRRVFVKDNLAYDSVDLIESHFDQPRYVLLVRDPRDMALTWKSNPMEAGGVGVAAQAWKQDQSASMRVYGMLRALDRIVLLTFEQLLHDPEHHVARVCDFLGIDFHPSMLDFHSKPMLQQNAGNLSSWTDLAKPLIRNNFGHYKSGLNDAEIKYIEQLCADEMRFFGYQPDFQVTESLEELEAALPVVPSRPQAVSTNEVDIFDRWHKVRNRIASRRLY